MKILALVSFGMIATVAACAQGASEPSGSLWSRDNLVAWCAAPPWDARQRNPEERARMLKDLGFRFYAYNWRDPAIPTFGEEIEAVQRQGIQLLGWALYGSDNPALPRILEEFRKHDIHPQLWLMQDSPNVPISTEGWNRLLPADLKIPAGGLKAPGLSAADREKIQAFMGHVRDQDIFLAPEAQAKRVELEAGRIRTLVREVAPYGAAIELYNHNGWMGMVENQVAVIRRLQTEGISNVGMVYNFSHARDAAHDDTKHFARIWALIEPYVVTVNLTGTVAEPARVYPSQGDRELGMMHIIEQSGWRGHVGVIAEKGGDAAVTLKNYEIGLDWLAAELRAPGAGGPKPTFLPQ